MVVDGWVVDVRWVVAGAAVVVCMLVMNLVVGLMVVGADVVAAVFCWMVEGGAVGGWVGAGLLSVWPSVGKGWTEVD